VRLSECLGPMTLRAQGLETLLAEALGEALDVSPLEGGAPPVTKRTPVPVVLQKSSACCSPVRCTRSRRFSSCWRTIALTAGSPSPLYSIPRFSCASHVRMSSASGGSPWTITAPRPPSFRVRLYTRLFSLTWSFKIHFGLRRFLKTTSSRWAGRPLGHNNVLPPAYTPKVSK